MMNGATSLMRRTRITCTSRTGCRGSSMIRSRGCTITVTGTTIRCRGGISHPMGLDAIENMTSGGLIYAVSGVPGLIAANSITNSAYQFGYDMDAIVGGAHNGAADAMRHCYLMCRMTKTFGSTIADVIGKNHEAAGDRQGQPAKERIMDLKNNTVGIACGDFSAKCSDACIEKYNTGQLFGLDGIKADNPIKAKQGSSDASNY